MKKKLKSLKNLFDIMLLIVNSDLTIETEKRMGNYAK